MTRGTLVALALLLCAMGGVGVGAGRLIEAARAALLRQFAEERLKQVDEVSRIVHDDFDSIRADLRFVGQLVQSTESVADRSREIGALLAASRQYHLVGIYDLGGDPLLSVTDPVPDPDVRPEAFEVAMRDTARTALTRLSGELETTVPLEVNGGWFRIFATSLPDSTAHTPAAVAVLVDTQQLFAKLRLITTEPDSHLVLLGAHGRPTSVTSPELISAVNELEHTSGPRTKFSSLIEEMRMGKRGLVDLAPHEASALGLGQAEVVVAYAPIQFQGRGHWSVATLTSTAKLSAHEHALVWRLGAAAIAVALSLIAFGVYVAAAARRAGILRERLRHSEHLALLHERTEQVLDNIPTCVMTLSADATITSVNRAFRDRMASPARDGTIAQAFPGASSAAVALMTKLLADARVGGKVQSVLGDRLTLFGDEGRYNLHAVPLDPRFEEARILLVIEDLSEVQALEAQLLRAEKLSTVGVLAAGVAHEMGTPLGVVRGRAEYILDKIGAEHPQASGMSDIIEQIDHVTRTIRQLLDFSRSSPPSVQRVSLGDVVGAVRELLRFELDRQKLSLVIEIPEDLPALSADPDQLQQVLVNVLKNACDACAAGGRIRVRASIALPGGADRSRVRIEVEDDGCGIPPNEQARIFDPFYTTKKRGQGTGLGLTVGAQIVRNHEGEIGVTSDGKRGACVSIVWPISDQKEARHANLG